MMHKKVWRRLLAGLLSLTLFFSMLPAAGVSIFAETAENVSNVTETDDGGEKASVVKTEEEEEPILKKAAEEPNVEEAEDETADPTLKKGEAEPEKTEPEETEPEETKDETGDIKTETDGKTNGAETDVERIISLSEFAEIADPEEDEKGVAYFANENPAQFEFHYTCSAGGWAGFGANLIDENGDAISATVSGDYTITSGRYTTTVAMPYTFSIDNFTKVFTTDGTYTFSYATVTDPNYGDEEHTFDVWPNEEAVGANELYGSEENPVVSVTIDGTAAADNPNYSTENVVSKTWHFTLTFADETSVTIPIYGNADGANDTGSKYCPQFLEINLYYEEAKEAVLNLGNGNGTYCDGDYTGSNASGGSALRYRTGDLNAYADKEGNVTLNLPSDADLSDVESDVESDAEFTVVNAVGNAGEADYQPALTIALGKEQAYDYKLVGWINIATGEYYDVSSGSTTAEIDLSEDNVFYADWVAASYNHGSSSDAGLREDTVSTKDFVNFQLFDYNELFNLYSAALTQNGTDNESWTDSESLYSEPLLGKDTSKDSDSLTLLGKSFIFQNSGTTSSGQHVLSHASPAKWNLWTANAAWAEDPEYRFVLDAEEYWNITSPDATILGMLYDTEEKSLGVHYVGDGDYLFWIDEDGYYTFDSAVSGAAYNQSEERFYVYNDKANSFFPYNEHTDAITSSNGLTNYWFGVSMEVNMYLPSATSAGSEENPVNQVDGKDMVFDFSGDDDIMIFIDDKLVVDMSGIHSASYSRINFSTNTVTYSMGLDEDGAPDTSGEGGKYYVDENLNLSAGGHTMHVFYMERGASASNLKIQFNVAPVWEYETGAVQTITANKIWENSDGSEITNTENMPDIAVGLFDVVGQETEATDESEGNFGYTIDGDVYTVTFTDDSGVTRIYEYDASGPTLTYTEVFNGEITVTGMDEQTDSVGKVLDKDGLVVAWLETDESGVEKLYIRMDKQTLNDENEWYYAWELLDSDGDYEVLELSEDTSFTTETEKEDLKVYSYWSIIGDLELEDILEKNNELDEEENPVPVILTEAAQEAENTLGDTKEAYGYVIVAAENGDVHTERAEFSQIATMNAVGSESSNITSWQGIYGVTSQSEVDALGAGALWYPEDAKAKHTDSDGSETEGFYLYCELDSRKYYLTLNEAGDGLTVTDDASQKSEFFYDLLGEFMISLEKDGVENAVRVEIDEEGNIKIDEAEWEAALDDVRIYTLTDTVTGGFAFTATNSLLYEFQLNKVETGKENSPLEGATFSLFKDEDCTEFIRFVVTEDENGDIVYTVENDSPTEEFTTVITAGSVTIAGLYSGTYYMKEIAAPNNEYVHLNEVIIITVSGNDDGSSVVTADGAPIHVSSDGNTVTVENDPRRNTQVPVQKVWEDEDDQDGVRPGSITFRLLADGEPAMDGDGNEITATVTADDDWAYIFTGLPFYQSEDKEEQNVEIEYTVTEDPIKDADGNAIYDTTIDETADGFIITNSHTPATTTVTVNKVWDDELVSHIRPDDITVQLLADGEPCGDAVTLTEIDGWTYTWEELPVNASGTHIEYTVEEAEVTGYETTYGEITGDAEAGYSVDITNTPTPEKLHIQKNVAGSTDYTRFEFTITLTSGDSAYEGDVEVTYTNGTNDRTETLTFNEGSAEFTLEAGEIITLTLPYGMSWEVVEQTTADSTVIFVDNDIADAASGIITRETTVRFVNSYNGYFPIDEEIVPDYTDRSTWRKEKAVNVYDATEFEMSTVLPVITGYDMENGSFTMNFHEVLDSQLVLNKADEDFLVFIDGKQVDYKYYTVTLAPEAEPASAKPLSAGGAIVDGCSFHVDVDLTTLYQDGVITEADLQGDTEIIIFFFAALDGTELNDTYKSTVWYEVYDGEDLQYTSNVDVVDVYTYEIEILKYDASTVDGTDYAGSALAGATFGVYYDEACTDAVIRKGEAYTVTSGADGMVIFYGLADGTYYIKETEAPTDYELSTEVLTVVLGEELNDNAYRYEDVFANTRLYEIELNKVETGDEGTTLKGAIFSLYKDAECTEKIGFIVTENDAEDDEPMVYIVSDDTEAESYTTTITAGTVTIAGLYGGTYYLREDTAPNQDYVHLNEVMVVTVSGDDDGSSVVTADGAPNHVNADGNRVTVKNDPRGNTKIPVQKVWDDEDDQDGVRPGFVTFHLYADGIPALDEDGKEITATVTADDDWACTFTDLPLYESEDKDVQDVEIIYTVTEDPITDEDGNPLYTTEITTDENGNYIITNSHTPATTTVTVNKVWDDELVSHIRPDDITVQLLADGEGCGEAVTLTESDDWTYTWKDLPAYSDGTAIKYTVEEANVAGYETTYGEITGDAEAGYSVDITNTPTPEKLHIQKTMAGTTDTTEYIFRITLTSEDNAYNGDINVTYDDGSTDTLTFTDGTADITLGAGETITLELIYGMSWEVVELTEGADTTVIYVNNEASDTALGTIEGDTAVRFVNSYRGYFPIDEEIVPDYTDRTTWVKEEAVNEYNAIEIEMSTLLPVITGHDLENGSFTMNFHEILDSQLVLDEADSDFMVFIDGTQIDHTYYTVTLASEAAPASAKPLSAGGAIEDGCSFHVDVDLTALYKDGVITEAQLQGDTEIIIFFFADLEGTGLNGTYTSTVWYDIYDGEDWQYTSNVDVVDVYTYEIEILKYDASTLDGTDYADAALSGATFIVCYDHACTDPVIRNGEAYTVTSGDDGYVIFYGLADGIYYVNETEAPSGYEQSTEVLTVVLGEELNDNEYKYEDVFANTPETVDDSEPEDDSDSDEDPEVPPDGITPTDSSDENVSSLPPGSGGNEIITGENDSKGNDSASADTDNDSAGSTAKTNDSSNYIRWIVILCAAVAVIISLLAANSRRNKGSHNINGT